MKAPKKKENPTVNNSAERTVDNKAATKRCKQQISLTIAPALLEKVDALANKMGQTRAAVINMAIYKIVEIN